MYWPVFRIVPHFTRSFDISRDTGHTIDRERNIILSALSICAKWFYKKNISFFQRNDVHVLIKTHGSFISSHWQVRYIIRFIGVKPFH